jgi:hypothetical protein
MLSPEAPKVTEILTEDITNYSYLGLCPNGGEKHGMLWISCIPLEDANELNNALVKLIKIESCCEEEWSLNDWDSSLVEKSLIKIYEELYAGFQKLEGQKEVDFIDSLIYFAADTVQAQYKGSPINKPRSKTSGDSGNISELIDLGFVNRPNLIKVICNRWNDLNGVFRDDKYWYLINWATNA